MNHYTAPGVYVEDVPSSAKPIAGVSTSIAGFIGVVPEVLDIPKKRLQNQRIGKGDGAQTTFEIDEVASTTTDSFEIRVDGKAVDAVLQNQDGTDVTSVVLSEAPTVGQVVTADYAVVEKFTPVAENEAKLCTNFSDFIRYFGGFSDDEGQNSLAHAVFGFLNNGGSRCHVVRVTSEASLDAALAEFEKIDEIAIVAAPGMATKGNHESLVTHCNNMKDRFAILDSGKNITLKDLKEPNNAESEYVVPDNSPIAGFYFPWLKVADPATKILQPRKDGTANVPPSGHVAGVFARVDATRGVHKAPANETVAGALGLQYYVTKEHQESFNPQGVNCIRNLNGNIRVWGARTVGGDANSDKKYINVQRMLLYLHELIDEGLQWAVFEPNSPELWQKIRRNTSAFLTNVWRTGALFGDTPEEAFYVKCDAETNPPSLRDQGQVVTEIGVSIVRPAEFVVFRISQKESGL